MAKSRRQYSGAAKPALLNSNITSSSSAISCDDLTGWPDGSVGPFYVVINRDQSNEESVLCSGRVGNSLTVQSVPALARGQNDTAAQSHSAGETIEHPWTKTDADDSNEHYAAAGAGGRDHIDLLNAVRHDVTSRHPVGTVIPRGTPTASNLGDTTLDGNTGAVADAGHRHARELLNSIIPAGSVWPYAGLVIPTGWLECAGQVVNRITYAGLFAAIGTTYGIGDGSTTFALPNGRDRLLIGSGGLLNPGTTGGNKDGHSHALGTLDDTAAGEHTHDAGADMFFITNGPGPNASIPLTGNSYVLTQLTRVSGSHNHSFTGRVGTGGSDGDLADSNLPPFIALAYIIKT